MKARLPKGYGSGGANNIQQLARQAQRHMAELVFNPCRSATVQRQIVRLCILYEHKNLVIRQSRKQQLIPQLWQMITSKNFYIFSHFISRRVAVPLRSNGLQRKKP